MGVLGPITPGGADQALDGEIDHPAQMRDVTPRDLRPRDKAAILVRLLVGQGVSMGVGKLSPSHQKKLAMTISEMGAIDRTTLAAVIREFTELLDNLALSFPDSLSEALEILDPHLSEEARADLKVAAEARDGKDPWARVSKQPVSRLRPLFDSENAEVCAVLLSKLSVAKAAELLSDLPQERAQALAYTVATTEKVAPDLVEQIGARLALFLDATPPAAFSKSAAERVGAILNSTPTEARDKVLDGLGLRDETFAREVRKAIFSFEHIPMRVEAMDVPVIMRKLDGEMAIQALAAGLQTAPLAVEFLLENMSKRLAEQMRDEAEQRGAPKPEEGELAMSEVVSVIRDLEAAGELSLLPPPD